MGNMKSPQNIRITLVNRRLDESIVEQIVELYHEGLSYRAIGRALGISDTTVKRYVKEEQEEVVNEVQFETRKEYKELCEDWEGRDDDPVQDCKVLR